MRLSKWQLNTTADVYQVFENPTARGTVTRNETLLTTVDFSIRQLSARELEINAQVGRKASHRGYCRPGFSFNENQVIVSGGRRFNVRFVNDVGMRGELVQLELLEVTGGGYG